MTFGRRRVTYLRARCQGPNEILVRSARRLTRVVVFLVELGFRRCFIFFFFFFTAKTVVSDSFRGELF